ncbi:hypothetical protein F8M41_007923 [Gigaspora margarita]|uniref:Restriction endonuclease type IV Mrr domain-containing protein n=1 Tax=Gigaspora margarita TaxID=4874 RepID=A0A8H4A2Q8_GIGMA|nr:hypothetical protein F8M41_007923 [Gigaspora margarita]
MGIEVIHVGRRGDGGVDIKCWIKGKLILIQCKNWTNDIGNYYINLGNVYFYHGNLLFCYQFFTLTRRIWLILL